MYSIDFSEGIVNNGDTTRIQKVFEKARGGGKLSLVFLGGSITAGCLSSVHEKCYAYLVYKWWCENFPDATFEYINAGVGGTGSDFGVARVEEDVLSKNPDLILIEFSVNDSVTDYFEETYEGLVRRCLNSTNAAVMAFHNICYDSGNSAEDMHSQVEKHYKIPAVSIRPTVYKALTEGRFEAKEITSDNLHPNDSGHLLLSCAIIRFLETVYRESTEKTSEYGRINDNLPKPVTLNRYENATLLREPGFTAFCKGEKMSWDVESNIVSVQFVKTVCKPAPIARITVDGGKNGEAVLDANFDEDWGDCMYTVPVYADTDASHHHIEIEIIKDHSEDEIKDKSPFKLLSLTVSR